MIGVAGKNEIDTALGKVRIIWRCENEGHISSSHQPCLLLDGAECRFVDIGCIDPTLRSNRLGQFECEVPSARADVGYMSTRGDTKSSNHFLRPLPSVSCGVIHLLIDDLHAACRPEQQENEEAKFGICLTSHVACV